MWHPLPRLKELEGIKVGDSIRANEWKWKIESYRGQLRGIALQYTGRESGAGLFKNKGNTDKQHAEDTKAFFTKVKN